MPNELAVTVCQLPDPSQGLEEAWKELCARPERGDLVLLPEMPFYDWLHWTDDVDPAEWEKAVDAHHDWIGRLHELEAACVVATRPVTTELGARHNQAFSWRSGTVENLHIKYYLPDEPGFWEATWYERGDGTFETAEVLQQRAGLMICTEMWFTEHARAYARLGANLLLTPRMTEAHSVGKWLAGGRSAAVMGGAFSLSSNRAGSNHGLTYGGLGWVIGPDGQVLATTSDSKPFVTVEIDLDLAEKAKSTYPRYVAE